MPSSYAFHVLDMSNRIVGHLDPIEWEVTDPLRAAGQGTITVALPTDEDEVTRLETLVTPLRRWVAIEDDLGAVFFAGPIPKRATKNGQTVVIPVVDWRSWFYQTPIRPTTAGAKRTYIKVGAAKREQVKIMRELAALALDHAGKPTMIVDPHADSGVLREITANMLDQPIASHLDAIMNRDRGCEWYTYVTTDVSDALKRVPHFAVAYPERTKLKDPISLTWIEGEGGTARGFEPGESEILPNRAWATGEGQPNKQPWGMSETAALRKGGLLAWETLETSDAKKKAGAYEYAVAKLKGQNVRGTVDLTVDDERITPGSMTVGDRARVEVDDGWNRHRIYGARIVQRVISGGARKPTLQKLTVDLDDLPNDKINIPGYEVQSG